MQLYFPLVFYNASSETVIPFNRIRVHWDRRISYLDIILRHGYMNMKNISKNISTVCPGCAIRNARKLQLERRIATKYALLLFAQTLRSRCKSVLQEVYIAFSASDNRILNCAIDRRRDLINYANSPPVLRVTIRTFYIPNVLHYRETVLIATVSRVAASSENLRQSPAIERESDNVASFLCDCQLVLGWPDREIPLILGIIERVVH